MTKQQLFFVNVLMQIIFVTAILRTLTYIRILPLAIKYIGGFVSKVTGLPKVESFVAVNSMIFGDTSAILAVKSFIPKLSDNRLFIIVTSSLVTVSASILGAYISMIPAEFVLVALPINVFFGLILSSIVCPVSKEEDDEKINIKEMLPERSLFEAIGNWTIKVAANEFVAMLDFTKMIPHMSHKTVGIVSAFLISFANFSSIGIILGTLQTISHQKASELAKVGLKVLLVATMESILTGAIVGLFL
ncbi:nucleoside transporter C-terminal domain-containing protein [Bacillus cereus]